MADQDGPSRHQPTHEDTPTGADTMSPAMADMIAYPRYLFRQVAHRLGDRVWEIGVGHGTYTRWLRDADKQVLATDIDESCLTEVQRKFADDSAVTTAHTDLNDAQMVRCLASFAADSVICFNVLEHLPDDTAALTWIRDAVAPSAVLGLIVPAHDRLFGRMDSEAGHFRRYSRRTAREALTRAGWKVDDIRYINVLGAAGWYYHNRWRRDAGLADKQVNHQMHAADRWLPRIARLTDPLFARIAGLSVVAIAHA
ncbi:MAG: methyltransferase domain-containing protein [Pirellulaceae bacterium]